MLWNANIELMDCTEMNSTLIEMIGTNIL